MSKIIKNGIVYGETLLPAAGNIAYDNTASGLNATTMQNAITELKDMYDLPKGYAWAGTQEEWDNLTVQEKALYDGKLIAIIGDNDIPADNVIYDNTTSGMTATDAQAAIDELSAGLGSLGDLATADTASDIYTPAGTVSQPTFTGTAGTVTVTGAPAGTVSQPTTSATVTSTTVNSITDRGTLPIFTYDSTTKNLTYTDGTLPTKGPDTSVVASVTNFITTQPTFSGSEMTSTGSFTPTGTVSQPTFTGTAATITVEPDSE